MSELLRSKHAFGSEVNVDQALLDGKIDAYDILFLNEGKIGWINKDGEKVILEDKKQILPVSSLPDVGDPEVIYIFESKFYFWNGEEYISPESEYVNETTVDTKVAEAVGSANAYTDKKLEGALEEHVVKKYEISSKPEGTIVDYREKEIRVMCPADTVWTKQSVGATGNANMYYMGFKAYAPDGAVSFKEGDRGVIIDEMFTFDDEFAGTDEYGRNYSICWLALASYDEASDSWTYFGKNSTISKYIGWDYVVEWYDSNGLVIASDSIRINLSNESCHSKIEPYYIANVISDIDVKIAALEAAYTIVEF